MQSRQAAVLGAGTIGVAFAVLLSTSGWRVRLWDPDPEATSRGAIDVRARIDVLRNQGMVFEPTETILSRVEFPASVNESVAGADLVQECAPERLEVKRQLFASIEASLPADAVLASSSSAIRPSLLAEGLACAGQIIVGHPGNPPHLLPLIEVVPSQHTRSTILASALEIYRSIGLDPILVEKEIEGFVFNRLQGAVLREAYCLVRDGVASVEAIDTVMRKGLGRRWAFMGPFETVDLNTRGGIASHAEKMGPSYARMGAERGQRDPWTPELVARVEAERRAQLPADTWQQRVDWRDEQLLAFRRHFDRPTSRECSCACAK